MGPSPKKKHTTSFWFHFKSFESKENIFLSVMKNYNINKTHGWDDVSFLKTWFYGNIYKKLGKKWRIHKKELKNVITNYRPISLLFIFRKILENLMFCSLFNYLIQNKFFTVSTWFYFRRLLCCSTAISYSGSMQKFVFSRPTGITGNSLIFQKLL